MDIPALPSRIDAVTVFRQGARVTRTAVWEPRPGGMPGEVRLSGLPLSIEDDSVRARFEPDDPDTPETALPRIRDLRVAVDVPDPDHTLPPPSDTELENAGRDVALRQAHVKHLEDLLKRLDQLGIADRPEIENGPPPASPLQARLALLDFQARERQRLEEKVLGERKGLEEAIHEEKTLRLRAAQASGARQVRKHEVRKSAVLRLSSVDGAVPPRVRVVLEYTLPGPRWAPAYQLGLSDGGDDAELSMRALVAQRTGEDWRRVTLTLSTALPMNWTDLPELASLRIGRRQPAPARRGWREPPEGADALWADYDRAKKSMPAPPPEPYPADLSSYDEEVCEDEGDYFAGAVAAEEPEEDLFGAAALDECLAEPEEEAFEPPVAAKEMMAMPVAASAMPPPAPMEKKKMARPRSAPLPAPGRAAAPQMLREEPDDGIDVGQDLLRYGRLRMMPPHHSARGQLKPASAGSLYAESLSDRGLSPEGDVAGWVKQAQKRSRKAGASLPEGHVAPDAIEGFDHAYRCEGPVDIPADGAFHAIPVLSAAARAKRHYVAVPRMQADVFRSVTVTNPLDAPLLPGPCDVYLADTFQLTAPLRVVVPKGDLELGLGVEPAIKAARNTTFKEETEGLLGGRLNLEHRISIEVRNLLAQVASVEVRERIPVGDDEDSDCAVEVAADPPWEPFEQRRQPLEGGYRWRIDVPPGGRKELTATYVIEIPSKREIRGGNRRE